MTQPIYRLAQFRYTEAWYVLSKEEQARLVDLVNRSVKNAGGEVVVSCAQVWASENFIGFHVEKFPSLEALQMHTMTLYELGWYRYVEASSTLGVEMP